MKSCGTLNCHNRLAKEKHRYEQQMVSFFVFALLVNWGGKYSKIIKLRELHVGIISQEHTIFGGVFILKAVKWMCVSLLTSWFETGNMSNGIQKEN